MIASRRTQLIAIVGGSGAGKGCFVGRLCALLGDKACHLELDDFYRDRSMVPPKRRGRVNFDLPRAIDWTAAQGALVDCKAQQTTRIPRYDFATHCRMMDREGWQPRPIVFVDGLWLLRRPDVRRLFDLTIYLDTPTELRRSRRLERDVAERGYNAADVATRLTEEVMPMHERYVAPQKKWADLVLSQPFQEAQLIDLAQRLWAQLEMASPLPPWMHETFRAELIALLLDHESAR